MRILCVTDHTHRNIHTTAIPKSAGAMSGVNKNGDAAVALAKDP